MPPRRAPAFRRLRYQVAASLDGFIAGRNGEYDWIVGDPAIDFAALYREFDTVVMGRKTYELAATAGNGAAMPGLEVIAFSKTLAPATRPGVRITDEDPVEVVRTLKTRKGRDIWLFGGGQLFRTLLDAGLVDMVEIAVMPVLLGAGIPLLPEGSQAKLVLADHRTLRDSGIVVLAYRVEGSAAPPARIRYVKRARARQSTRSRQRR
jgi:dihydrofolate reductase